MQKSLKSARKRQNFETQRTNFPFWSATFPSIHTLCIYNRGCQLICTGSTIATSSLSACNACVSQLSSSHPTKCQPDHRCMIFTFAPHVKRSICCGCGASWQETRAQFQAQLQKIYIFRLRARIACAGPSSCCCCWRCNFSLFP